MSQLVAGSSYRKVQILRDQPLGNGAYGMVCRALCDELPCAAKVLHPVLVSERNTLIFRQECQLLSSVKHPNIIQYLGTHLESPNSLVLLMELMDESLTSFLERSARPIPLHTEVNLCHDISLALVHLHANDVIHRDLSSNNILLSGSTRAKVTDFGMTTLIGSNAQVSKLTHVPGCPVYMSPEAMAEPPTYSSKLDIFSFGVLTIQILTGKYPNPGPSRQRQGNTKSGMPVEVLVPDIERRKAHIDLVDPSHPLLHCALVCLNYLEKDRPTAQEMCSQMAALKNVQYTNSVQVYSERTLSSQLAAKELQLKTLCSQLEAKDKELARKEAQLNEERKCTASKLQAMEAELQGQLSTKRRQMRGLQSRLLEAMKKGIAEVTSKLEADSTFVINAVDEFYVECPICLEECGNSDMVQMPGCQHSVCKECFKNHFTNVIKTQSIEHFNCPVCAQPDTDNADYDVYLDDFRSIIGNFCSREVYELCSQKLMDYHLSKDPNACWCANAHKGLTCDQFAQWKHDNDPQLQQQGLAAYLEANGIECPNCHNWYELAQGGSMHFICTQCPNEFCSGCGQSFKQGQVCKRFASCAKRGLHAHHPRNCLFFLRDFTVEELQRFLEMNKVPFLKDPPRAQIEAANGKGGQLWCSVMLQKETVDGLKDEPCGKDAVGGYAGLCSVHYTEYLVIKINKPNLDPISLYNVCNLEAMLSREDQKIPEKEDDEKLYKEKLIKHIQQVLPFQRLPKAAALLPE